MFINYPGWYHRLSQYFKNKFGSKVYKIPVHAGFTCPNRDGTISSEGCYYCYNPGFSPSAAEEAGEPSLEEQVWGFIKRREKLKEDGYHSLTPRGKYLVYFQSYTNTYGSTGELDKLYRQAVGYPGVIGISVATRPDCLSQEVVQLLASYADEYHVWVELGLQSSHNKTLEEINRRHTAECFAEAAESFQETAVNLCAHIINGLPGETMQHMLDTVKFINALPLNGIKFHQLQVVAHTPLAGKYKEGEFKVLTEEGYLDIVCSQLELLREDIVVHRLMSEVADPQLLIAPRWDLRRSTFSQKVEQELKNRNSFQGAERRVETP